MSNDRCSIHTFVTQLFIHLSVEVPLEAGDVLIIDKIATSRKEIAIQLRRDMLYLCHTRLVSFIFVSRVL